MGARDEPKDLADRLILARLHLGAGFTSTSSVLQYGPGVGFFFGRGLALSVEVDHRMVLFREAFIEKFPGIDEAVPVHQVKATAAFEWILMPHAELSPYLRAGLGPMIHTGINAQGRRILGYAEGGVGVIFYLDGFYIDAGAMVSGRFPDARHEALWTFDNGFEDAGLACRWSARACSLRIEPRIGLNYAFVWPQR